MIGTLGNIFDKEEKQKQKKITVCRRGGMRSKATQTDDDWMIKYVKGQVVNSPREERSKVRVNRECNKNEDHVKKGRSRYIGGIKWRYELRRNPRINENVSSQLSRRKNQTKPSMENDPRERKETKKLDYRKER